MMTTRTTTWENIGTNVETCNNSIEDILHAANLDYTVECRPVTVSGISEANDKFKAIVRCSDDYVYNITKNSYTVCQNREAFSIVDDLHDHIKILKAGETHSGMIYMIAEMAGRKILGDEFKTHLILMTSHNSEFALKAAITPLRIICQNQFNVAFREAKNTHSIKHTASISNQIAAARDILKTEASYMDTLNRNAEALAIQSIKLEKVVDNLFPMPENASERVAATVDNNRQLFLNAYNSNDNQNFKGTAWGALNAATDYYTHKPLKRGSEQSHFVNSVLYPEFINRAFEVISES